MRQVALKHSVYIKPRHKPDHHLNLPPVSSLLEKSTMTSAPYAPSSSNPSAPSSSALIELQVGERRFTTRASTLIDGSTTLAGIISDRFSSSRSSDGSYFVDADPDLFEHLLRYMRRNVVLPVFYNENGFDHALYRALQVEADYFNIQPLNTWLKEKGYLRAVSVQYLVDERKGEGVDAGYDAVVDGNTERTYHPSWGTEKVYQCPRDISTHHGNPNLCGRACARTQGENEGYVDREVLRTLVVTKKVVFNNLEVPSSE